jgi:hypothetical protein
MDAGHVEVRHLTLEDMSELQSASESVYKQPIRYCQNSLMGKFVYASMAKSSVVPYL